MIEELGDNGLSTDVVGDLDLIQSLQIVVMEQGSKIIELEDRIIKLENGFRSHYNNTYAHQL